MSGFSGTIRPATPGDLRPIVKIYNQAVQKRVATCDLSDVEPGQRQAWLDRHRDPYGIWVAEDGSGIQGWVALSSYDPKPCFHKTATFATYVANEAQGCGIGTALRAHMIAEARRRGFHALVNRMWANNDASIALAKRFGFRQVGHMPELVELEGRYIDCLFFQLLLDKKEPGQEPQATPTHPGLLVDGP